MARFALRHWTAILILLVVTGWSVLYLPNTPHYAIFQLKQTIDAHDGNGAAQYIDFDKVVRNAGYEMVRDRQGSGDASDVVRQFLGKGAVDLLSGPMAVLLKQWATQQVDDGAKEVQMPAAAVAGALVMLHRSGDTAYTRWKDHKGQVWEVQLAHEDGGWKAVEVKNVKQLLNKLKHEEEKRLNAAP